MITAHNALTKRRPAAVPARRGTAHETLVFKPSVEIFESEREITLIADMPGVAAEDMNIEWRDGQLAITGRMRPWEGPQESDIRVEFEIGRYSRHFALPPHIDHDRIEARYTDGILRLTLPKSEDKQPRSIAVRTG
jgi:HSP20 family molecular chaperone IbpA